MYGDRDGRFRKSGLGIHQCSCSLFAGWMACTFWNPLGCRAGLNSAVFVSLVGNPLWFILGIELLLLGKSIRNPLVTNVIGGIRCSTGSLPVRCPGRFVWESASPCARPLSVVRFCRLRIPLVVGARLESVRCRLSGLETRSPACACPARSGVLARSGVRCACALVRARICACACACVVLFIYIQNMQRPPQNYTFYGF